MILTKASLINPVAVAVGAILAVIFGVISMLDLPIQLTPDVERPRISIRTNWRAAAPNEVETELLEPQETALRGLPGLRRLVAEAEQGSSNIDLEFGVEADMQVALIEVINRLNQVPSYPVDVDEPRITVGSNSREDSIAWYSLQTVPGNPRAINTYQDFAEDVIQPRLERVAGVANSDVRGGRNEEVRITFDPYKAASLNVDITNIASALGSNTDVSAGFQEIGKRQYTVRFAGKMAVADLGELVLRWDGGRPVRLRDIATVEKTQVDPNFLMTGNGNDSIFINIVPRSGANILEVMQAVRTIVAELRSNELAQAGLVMEQRSDDTSYVDESIAMVRGNMLLGMALAIGVLWWFLRKFRATLIVALSIPLCLMAAFMVLDFSGRSLNIISLAGLAFATGMVLDAAIVVLENIFRQREKGLSGDESAYRGTTQVWGALLASTATTVAIFMPVVFMQDEAGQLFSDLAVVISAAVVMSLIVAVTVLPAAASRLLGNVEITDGHEHWWNNTSAFIMRITATPRLRGLWVAGLILIPLALAIILKPPADYLPEGKRNNVSAFMTTAPGMGFATAKRELMDVINDRLRPYLAEGSDPRLDNFFVGFFGNGAFMNARAADPADVDKITQLLNSDILRGFPDTFGGASRRAIFGGRGGRNIDIDLQAADFASLLAAGRAGFDAIQIALPGANVRPQPGLELAEPELRMVPDDRRIAEVGWNRERTATAIRALGNGVFLGDYFDGDRKIDIILRGPEWETPEELAAMPLALPNGSMQTLGDLARIERVAGPSKIRRIDRRRTLTLQVTPPSGMPMEVAITTLQEQVDPVLRTLMPADGRIAYTGTAEALSQALLTMSGSFLLAIVILYLLISALFKSFVDSLLVITTIPMATVGGVICLRIVDAFFVQPMDLLTMMGFVILLGLVVNNAILLVYRAREGERDGESRRDAVAFALRLRLRPILMSTTTTVFGMLPLLVLQGSGSELYRGMAAVIVGGLLVSTLFTLVLLPSMLRFREEMHPARNPDPIQDEKGQQYPHGLLPEQA